MEVHCAVSLTESQRRDSQKLAEAALRNLHLDCRCDSSDGGGQFQSRLLHFGPGGLVIDPPRKQGQPVELSPGQQITCTCRLGREILRFAATVRRGIRFRLNAQTDVQATLLDAPGRLEVVQRRRYYRVSLLGRSPLDVTLWPVGVGTDGKAAVAGEFHGRIKNISAGGIGALLKDESFFELAKDRQVWARFTLPEENESLIFQMNVRHREFIESSGMWYAGLEIVEFIEPGAHELVVERLTRFVARQERVALNRRKDR